MAQPVGMRRDTVPPPEGVDETGRLGVTQAVRNLINRQARAGQIFVRERLSIDQIANRLRYAASPTSINDSRPWHALTPHAYRVRHRVPRRVAPPDG